GLESVEGVIDAGHLDRRTGDVDVLDRSRAAGSRVNAEPAAVGEKVQHAPSLRERARKLAVLSLIEKKSGLLPRGRIDAKTEIVLGDFGRGLAVADPLRL